MAIYAPLPTVDTVKELVKQDREDCCSLCGTPRSRGESLYTQACKGCGNGFSPLCKKCVFFPKDTITRLEKGLPETNRGLCAHCVLEHTTSEDRKFGFIEWMDPDNLLVLDLAQADEQFVTWAEGVSKVWVEAERVLKKEEAVQRQDTEK